MTTEELLQDLFARVRELVPGAVDGLDEQTLATQPEGGGNPIAWLVWHAARVQDDHLTDAFAAATGGEQVWETWRERFALDLGPDETGYGHTPEQVARVRASADLLIGYSEAVSARTEELLRGLADGDLDRVVDEDWDPPVTLGSRLVSVIGDCTQHLGQAGYVRGLLGR